MNSRHKTWVGLSILLLVTYAVYSPGLSGGFLFDDFVNLNALGATGPVDNWQTFFRYVTSGTADPTGRPIAMLSFLLDARDWPADPSNFLRTNLLIHLTNGVLLFNLIRELGRWLGDQKEVATRVALFATSLWLLHPLFVSTTLYIVQREAMLPTTMILGGLLVYLHGRKAFDLAPSFSSLSWMALGILGGTFLAVLCKGNGILLPLLALILECIVIQPTAKPAVFRSVAHLMHRLLLVVPTLCIAIYLLSFIPLINQHLTYRDWTIGERLITQPRVLIEYLFLLFVPRSVSSGVYNDGYVLSTGLIEPTTTLPAILIVVALPILAWLLRKKAPSLAAATLFFFAGHLLESSVVPLEIYFEHRNYLPAVLLFWPVSRSLLSSTHFLKWRIVAAVTLVAIVSLTTYQRSVLWGQPYVLAQLWAAKSPSSSRAQATIAMMERSSGRPELALARLGPRWQREPNDLQIAFNYIDAACALRGITRSEIQALESSLASSNSGLSLIHGWLGNAIEASATNRCSGLDLRTVESWLKATERNPAIALDQSSRQDIEPLLGLLEIEKGNPDSALKHFNLAFSAFPTPSVAARQAAILASRGYYKQAVAHLDFYESKKSMLRKPGMGMPLLHDRVLAAQHYWPNEMRVLRQKLAAELEDHPKAQPAEAPPR